MVSTRNDPHPHGPHLITYFVTLDVPEATAALLTDLLIVEGRGVGAPAPACPAAAGPPAGQVGIGVTAAPRGEVVRLSLSTINQHQEGTQSDAVDGSEVKSWLDSAPVGLGPDPPVAF